MSQHLTQEGLRRFIRQAMNLFFGFVNCNFTGRSPFTAVSVIAAVIVGYTPVESFPVFINMDLPNVVFVLVNFHALFMPQLMVIA